MSASTRASVLRLRTKRSLSEPIHQSNDVWTLEFDSGDTLGVTASHPIYSTTAQDWRLTSELAIGEQVLTHAGSATLTGKRPAPAQTVYNLEVQEVHNFLVAEVGVVVHNSCIDALFDFYKFMFRNPDDVAHILRGKVNSAGLGTGCHHKSAFDMGTARIRPGSATTPPNQHGVYEAFVDVKDSGGVFQPKIKASTFFPDDWDQIKTMENITHAWESADKVPGTTALLHESI